MKLNEELFLTARLKELDKEFKMLTWLQSEVSGVGGKNVTAFEVFNMHNV